MDDEEEDAAGETIDVLAITGRFRAGVDLELAARLDAWPPDFTHIQIHEVIGGMLARQATLVKGLADAPPIWTIDSAPVILRAIADVYINIAWLLLNPQERCIQFISFGLGQAKLQLEHYRIEFASRKATPEETAMLDAEEQWIDSQRATFLQDVNLGNWAGTSVRKMAVEADCLDFYNFVYMPFSACAHSMWHHIARYNLVTCANPLHRHHRRPTSAAVDPDIEYLVLAAKYWAKTLDTWARFYRKFRPSVSNHLETAARQLKETDALLPRQRDRPRFCGLLLINSGDYNLPLDLMFRLVEWRTKREWRASFFSRLDFVSCLTVDLIQDGKHPMQGSHIVRPTPHRLLSEVVRYVYERWLQYYAAAISAKLEFNPNANIADRPLLLSGRFVGKIRATEGG